MKNKKKKLLCTLGAIATIFVPTSIILSCGNSPIITHDQALMNGITAKMVKEAFHITPNVNKLPTDTVPPTTKTNVTLNGLAGVTITISDVKPDDDAGTLTVKAAISKTGLTPPTGSPFTITWVGYKKNGIPTPDQQKMNGITGDMVKNALGIMPDPTKLPSKSPKPMDKTNVTLNGLTGVTIVIHKDSTFKVNDDEGTITITANVFKQWLTPPGNFKITWNGYLTIDQQKMNGITKEMVKTTLNVSLNNGLWADEVPVPSEKIEEINNLELVHINVEKWVPNIAAGTIEATVSISKEGLVSPQPFIINWTGYRTAIKFSWTKLSSGIKSDNSAKNSSSIKIDDSTLLVGTYDSGFYKVDITNENWIWTKETISGLTDNSGRGAKFKKIDKTTLLIGTYDKGFYKLDFSRNTWTWTKETFAKSTDNSGRFSSIEYVYTNTLLIGTFDLGFYTVDISKATWVWTPVTNHSLTNTSAQNSNILLVNNNNLIVATSNHGFYHVDFSNHTSWKWTITGDPTFNNTVALSSSIAINDTHSILVGTNNKGFYNVDISKYNWVWKKITVSGFTDNSGANSSIVKADSHSFLVGTNDKGFYKIDTSKSPWLWVRQTSAFVSLSNDGGKFSSLFKFNDNSILVGTYNQGFCWVFFSG